MPTEPPLEVPNSYDETPYPGLSYEQCHVDRLATIATLLGLSPAPVERCRVLELGCAVGGNLLPMAWALPGSTFVGIDLSAREIAQGQASVEALGLRNVDLRCMDILDVSPELGQFDYILAHGVYSWVPPAVQDRLLAVCRANLAPQGVAYVSYNTYPGWHVMRVAREAMLYHTRDLHTPQERVAGAREMLEFLVGALSPQIAHTDFLRGYADFFRSELDSAGAKRDAFLLHDELAAINEPLYFHQFVEHAARHGLQYLAEAQFHTVFTTNFPAPVQEALQGMARDIVEMEQYMDFVRNRMFRQTLLCHAGPPIDRALDPEALFDLYVASQAKPASGAPDLGPGVVERFVSSKETDDEAALKTDHPVSKAAMVCLYENWPRVLPFAALCAEARDRVGLPADPQADPEGWGRDAYNLALNLLHAYSFSGRLVDLHTWAPPLAVEAGERPLAGRVARFEARGGETVPNLWHQRVRLDDFQRYLLPLLDGTRDRAALLEDVLDAVQAGALSVEEQGQAVQEADALRALVAGELEHALHGLAYVGLLVDG